jgi:hypothetical protein
VRQLLGVLPAGLRRHRTDALCCLALVSLAILLSVRAWTAPIAWDPDGLAYQAKTLEYSGVPHSEALSRAFALRGLATPQTARIELLAESEAQFASDMRWYRRRVVVSEAASWVRPVLGDRSLLAVSIAAYVLFGAALYILLRLWFARPFALLVTSLVLAFPPLQRWSFAPMTDSAGVLSLTLALIAATLTVRRGRRWLPLWAAAIAIGSFTRESIAAAVAASAVLVIRRAPRSISLFAVGAAALAPAALLLRYPMRLAFANVAARHLRVPVDTSNLALLKHWAILAIGSPLYDLVSQPLWTGILLVTVAMTLFARVGGADSAIPQAAAVGALIYLASFPSMSDLRLEIILLPAAAIGTGLLAQDIVATARLWLPARRSAMDTA